MTATLAAFILRFATCLRAALADAASRDRARVPFLVTLHAYIGRFAARLERLLERWQAGTLPRPRARPRPEAAPDAEAKPRAPAIRFPPANGWLTRMLPQLHTSGGELIHLLNRPEMAEFLEAVPQARRLLRPICRMLGLRPIHMAVLARPAPRRPTPPSPPPAEPRRRGRTLGTPPEIFSAA
jgi:hypothetical protein